MERRFLYAQKNRYGDGGRPFGRHHRPGPAWPRFHERQDWQHYRCRLGAHRAGSRQKAGCHLFRPGDDLCRPGQRQPRRVAP